MSAGTNLSISVADHPLVGLDKFTPSELEAIAASLRVTFPENVRMVYYGPYPPSDRNLPWQKTLDDGITPVGGIKYFTNGKWTYPFGSDFSGPPGPAGPAGPQGDTGPPGSDATVTHQAIIDAGGLVTPESVSIGGGGTADDGKVMKFLPSGGIQASAATGYAISGRSWEDSISVGALYGEASGAGMGITASSTSGYGANFASTEGIGMRVIANGAKNGAGGVDGFAVPIAMFQDTWNYTKRLSVMRSTDLKWEFFTNNRVLQLRPPASPSANWNWDLPNAGGTLALTSDIAGLVTISQLSMVGGASKVAQYDANGNLAIGPLSGGSTSADVNVGNLRMPVAKNIQWYKQNGTVGANQYLMDGHSGGDELFTYSPRVCFYFDQGFQFGQPTGITARAPRFVYFNPLGTATSGDQTRESISHLLHGNWWNGSTAVSSSVGQQYVPNSATGGEWQFWAELSNQPIFDGKLASVSTNKTFAITNNGPRIPSGKVLTFPDGTTMGTAPARYGLQAVNSAGVSNSIVPVDSSATVALIAGVTYDIFVFASFTHGATGGSRLHLGYTGTIAPVGGYADTGSGAVVFSRIPFSGTSGNNGINGDPMRTSTGSSNLIISGLYTATTGGVLSLQYAQSVSDPTATILLAGSHIIARPVNI